MIDSFEGKYRFLSNFYPAPVIYWDITFPTVEHAYQAAKCVTRAQCILFAACRTPGEAKRKGRKIPLRANWDDKKLAYMRVLLRQKFAIPELRQKLLATEQEELVEGNDWGDTFWGVCGGVGKNHLGRILMQIRRELGG